MEWKHVLAYITGSVDQELLVRNAYLVTENRILRQQITGRVQLSNGERKTLAVIGKSSGGTPWLKWPPSSSPRPSSPGTACW
jgi:putative transposase